MKFVFTGPECSGKTTLSYYASKSFGLGCVDEMARYYLEERNSRYNYDDLIRIARLQLEEESRLSISSENLICDTDLLTIIIWSFEKFGKCEESIIDLWKQSDPRHYFLCKPDIKWQYDPQRENPIDRDRLFYIYQKYLEDHSLTFTIISGSLENRIGLIEACMLDYHVSKSNA